MVKFILKRIGTMIIAMFMIILITFTLMHSIPGGPFTNTKGVPEEVTQAMEAKYGLDQPMPVQFVKYLGNLLHGDFGPSYSICDEFGYVSCDKEGGELLFNHLSLRAGKKACIDAASALGMRAERNAVSHMEI